MNNQEEMKKDEQNAEPETAAAPGETEEMTESPQVEPEAPAAEEAAEQPEEKKEDKKDEKKKGFFSKKNEIEELKTRISELEGENVSEIEAQGKEFDPNFHQALMMEAVEGVEPNHVTEVLQKGYMLKDRILRAAMVKVSE